MDWNELFSFSVSPLELLIRGSAIYLFIFLVFRFLVRRDIGSMGVADILVLVLIADAAQNGMAGEYTSIVDGMVLIGTIIFWNYLFDWLGYRFPRLERLLEPPPLCLVREGRLQHRNLRKERISEQELMSKVREKGVRDLDDVESAHIESDGEISVIVRESVHRR